MSAMDLRIRPQRPRQPVGRGIEALPRKCDQILGIGFAIHVAEEIGELGARLQQLAKRLNFLRHSFRCLHSQFHNRFRLRS